MNRNQQTETSSKSSKNQLHRASNQDAEATSQEETTMDAAFSTLGSIVGEEKVEELRELVSSESKNAESKIMQFIKDLTKNLPEDFALPSFSSVKSHPVLAGGALAAGVGSIFLMREYFKRAKVSGSSKASKGQQAKKETKSASAGTKGRRKTAASSATAGKAKSTRKASGTKTAKSKKRS